MSVGISTTWPGKIQSKHIHYGDEQLIYVISGTGNQIINKFTTIIKSGSIFHIESGATHEVINTGEDNLVQLIISIPSSNQILNCFPSELSYSNKVVSSENFRDYLLKNYQNFDENKIQAAYFDSENNIIGQNKYIIDCCNENCNLKISPENCCMYCSKDEFGQPYYSDITSYICPYNNMVITLPIVYNNILLGYIRGGQINTVNQYGEIVILPKSRTFGIINTLRMLAEKILSNYLINYSNDTLKSNQDTKTQNKDINIKTLNYNILYNSKINNHFLYNTINMISSLAISEDADNTYSSLISFSKMMKYMNNSNKMFVNLSDEINFLENYLRIQKFRFGKSIKVNMHIDLSLMNELVPYNFLQPIIENSYIHGRTTETDNFEIDLKIYQKNDMLYFCIYDNGEGIEKNSLSNLKEKIKNRISLHGLCLVSNKLNLLYDDKFSFEISSKHKEWTKVEILLPLTSNSIL